MLSLISDPLLPPQNTEHLTTSLVSVSLSAYVLVLQTSLEIMTYAERKPQQNQKTTLTVTVIKFSSAQCVNNQHFRFFFSGAARWPLKRQVSDYFVTSKKKKYKKKSGLVSTISKIWSTCLTNNMICSNFCEIRSPICARACAGLEWRSRCVSSSGKKHFSLTSDSSTKQFVPGSLTDCYTNRVILGRTPKPASHPFQAVWKQLLHCWTATSGSVKISFSSSRFPAFGTSPLLSQQVEVSPGNKNTGCYRFRSSV